MTEVVCLGILVADVIARPVDELPERGTIGLVDSIVLRGGGSALNTSVALGRFGVRTKLLGKVGRDPFGDFLVSLFGQPGVDASGVSPDRILLKIDVEGYESAVIAGAHRTLRAARPPQLIIEFLTKALKSGAIESMVALGYDVWYVAPDRLVSVRTMADFARHQHLGSWNFYCTKNPRADIDRLAATLGIAVS